MLRNNHLALAALSLLTFMMFLFSCVGKMPPANYVDPFVGTAYVGHTHPSAMLPFCSRAPYQTKSPTSASASRSGAVALS